MDEKSRFSKLHEHYVAGRPGYPPQLIDILRNRYCLSPATMVADLGSGTGKLTELFLYAGCTVHCVEPNDDMRLAAETRFSGEINFRSIPASAEHTGLDNDTIDLITAGQAFHWFDVDRTRKEALRILRSGGIAAIVWNDRDRTGSDFARDYETLLMEQCPAYRTTPHQDRDTNRLVRFFGQESFHTDRIPHAQPYTAATLSSLLQSTTYLPKEKPTRSEVLHELDEIFRRHESGGQVEMHYETMMYSGKVL